jgi:5-exo-hydroxycamphor dehydrogenase
VSANVRVSRSVVFEAAGVPLDIRLIPVPAPGPGEIVLRVELAGVCGTDAHRLAGDLAAPDEPVCFGHEGVGIVVELGRDVVADRGGTPLQVGDRVYWSPPAPCGRCRSCVVDRHPVLCENLVWPVPADAANAAAYQEYALVGANSPLYRVPDGTSAESVIAFGCAMPTAIGGFERLGPVAGAVVVVQGAGPVGLAAVVLARRGGAERIIVIGAPEPRLRAATRLGATDVIPLSAAHSDRAETVRRLTDGRGADVVVEAAGHPSAFPEGFDLLAVNGRFLLMGLYSGDAVSPIDPVLINNRNLQVIGTLGSSSDSFREAVQIAVELGEQLGFADLVTARFPLERAEDAIRALGDGDTIKAVVAPGQY